MEQILNEDRDKAIEELEAFYIEIEEALQAAGWDYYITDREDLNDWETLKASVQVCNGRTIIPIWDGASSTTIYGDEYGNYRLRFWHDFLHLYNNLSFSQEDEKLLVKAHMYTAEEYGLSWLARKILFAETAGQLRYHGNKGDFPHNQAAFIDSCLKYGVSIASRYKH